MASLTARLYHRCSDILLKCGEFDDDRRLSSVFVVAELYPFRNELSTAANKMERVESCIDLLMFQNVGDSPALIFFLRFLGEKYHPGDMRYIELAEIATEIETFFADQKGTQDKGRHEEPSGKPATVNTDVSILFLAADPTDASRLRLGEELREIQEKLRLANLRERFELHQRMSVRPADISQALLDVQPQIVHFSGHGAAAGALSFENQVGETQAIQPDALAALFELFASQVECVVLNACYSETQASAISSHIDYVVGMNEAIGDEAAIAFAIGFYQALGAGRTIEEAYKLGCVQIQLQNISEHLTPVLIGKKQKHS